MSYEQISLELNNRVKGAGNLAASEQAQKDFVTDTFVWIHKQHAKEKRISVREYVQLTNRLAAYKNGAYNDYLDLLIGAASMGMLDIMLAQTHPAFSPEQARKRSKTITRLTGIEPVEPDKA